jgi:hypothetical protein
MCVRVYFFAKKGVWTHPKMVEKNKFEKSSQMFEVNSSSQFLFIIQRNISPEIFFDSLLSNEDLSKLLCTCRGMKEMILKCKTIFPIQEYEIKHSITDKMLGNMIMHYSSNIIKLTIPCNFPYNPLLTMDGYHHMALLHSNLLELSINHCLEGGLCVISHSLSNLASLSISDSRSVSSEDLDSLSKLTNLEKINLGNIFHLDDAAVVNYSTLTKIKSIVVSLCRGLSGLGLSYLVANKQFLVQLKIDYCYGISSEGYHCLTTLTNFTSFTVSHSKLDDIGLNMICSSCLLIEYLDVRWNDLITIEGLNNIHFLVHLNTLLFSPRDNNWLAKLSNNIALTHLDLSLSYRSSISNQELSSHLSSLTYLTSVKVSGKERVL